MNDSGIATLILSISAPGVSFKNADDKLNIAREPSHETKEYAATLIADYQGRFRGFATLPIPDVNAALEELAYALDTLKLDGVIPISNYDGYYLGDRLFDKLVAGFNRCNVVVFIHPNTPPGIECSHLGLSESMMDVCSDITRTTQCAIHGGACRYYRNHAERCRRQQPRNRRGRVDISEIGREDAEHSEILGRVDKGILGEAMMCARLPLERR